MKKTVLNASNLETSTNPDAHGTILVGDVGGTNARFALYRYSFDDPKKGEIVHREVRGVREYSDFASAMHAYLESRSLTGATLEGASLAVASAVVGDEVQFTNSPWRFSIPSIRSHFGFRKLEVLNDFEALGSSLDNLPANSQLIIQAGKGSAKGTEVVLGPGTGLGIALRHCETGLIIPSEGGHISFAPTDKDERELLDFIARDFPRVSYERILSGAGLERLYAFQRVRCGNSPADNAIVSAAEVARRSAEEKDEAAVWAIDRFLRILGHFAGDSVLMFGGFRGVYLAGGILPRLTDRLVEGGFTERFTEKGRFSSLMRETPIQLITDDTASLRGAALRLL
jgi:glucokinase